MRSSAPRRSPALVAAATVVLTLSACDRSTAPSRLDPSASAAITIDLTRTHFVSPAGSPDASGGWSDPWDLATALSGANGRVRPGAVIWLRSGVYAGDFRSTLTGTADQPIVVRRFPGERATIEGRLRADGAYTTYWGFEIRQADATATDWPALEAYAPGGRYVNLVIHDAGENGISFRTASGTSEVYGCIVFNNGNDEGLDQGIYAPSDATVDAKWIVDNVFFNNLASGIQVFGDESHARIANVHVVGNIAFNNSSIAVTRRGGEENVTVGGDNNVVENITIRDNLLYFTPGVSTGMNLVAGMEREPDDPPQRNASVAILGNYVVGGSTVLSVQDWEEARVEGNTLVAGEGGRVLRLGDNGQGGLAGTRWEDNAHHRDPLARAWRYRFARSWEDFRLATGLGGTDRVLPGPPTSTKVVVRANRYESGRAHIAVYSPTGEAEVAVNVTGVLRVGDRFDVRNVQDVFGAPVASGVYMGGPLILPMAGVAPPAALGRGTAPVTGPYFNVFLLSRPEPLIR